MLKTVLGTLSAFSDGMQYGWTAPVVPKLQQPDTPVHIEESEIVWLETLLMLGGLAGLPITIYLVDKIGRKKSILVATSTSLVGWIIIACARRIELLFFARFIMGMAADVAFVATPMYIAEIADQKIRGFLGGLIYIMVLLGLISVYIVAPFVKIYISSLVGAAVTLLQLCSFSFMPESPYYLLLKQQKEQAFANLKWLRSTEDVQDEMDAITVAVERQRLERGRPQDLVLVKSNRKAMVIMTVLNAAQHFSGVSVMLMNLHSILTAAGSIYLDAETSAIVFAIIMLIFSISAIALVDIFGRKALLTSSSLLTGVSLGLLGAYFAVKNSGVDTTSFSWIPIFSVMFYAAVYRFGLGMVPIILTGELFPTSVKAMGMTYADAIYVAFASAALFMYQALGHSYGLHVPFLVYAFSCIFTAIFCVTYVPETKGKTLEEIQMLLKGGT